MWIIFAHECNNLDEMDQSLKDTDYQNLHKEKYINWISLYPKEI